MSSQILVFKKPLFAGLLYIKNHKCISAQTGANQQRTVSDLITERHAAEVK